MNIFLIIGLGITVVRYINKLFDDKSSQAYPVNSATEKRYEHVKYYSEGVLLPKPFHEEYKMISYTVADSWIYKEEWQDLFNENHDASIVEIDVKLPLPYRYSYTFKHVFLANSYLKEQKNYIEFLN
jgi:hypothetical protein